MTASEQRSDDKQRHFVWTIYLHSCSVTEAAAATGTVSKITYVRWVCRIPVCL